MTEKISVDTARKLTVVSLLSTARRRKEALVGLSLLSGVIIVAPAAPIIAPYNPIAQDISSQLQPPSWKHLLGTDYLGRDQLSRIIYGAQIDLEIAIALFVIASVSGTAIGIVAGYRGGKLDEALMRITDVFLSFPDLILALTIAAVLGHGIINVIIALSITFWTPYARLARAQTLQVKRELYIEAASAVGASDTRIVTRDILPMIVPAALVHAALQSSQVILSAATLGFLGLGAQPPAPEWGLMIQGGLYYITSSWWLSVFPGLAIVITTFAFNLLGDSVRDLLDVRSMERR